MENKLLFLFVKNKKLKVKNFFIIFVTIIKTVKAPTIEGIVNYGGN